MRVLLVTESYWPNADGGALFERRLVQGLIGRGHQAAVWAPGTGWSDYIEQDGASRIYREKSMPVPGNPRFRMSYFPFFRARRVLRQERPDILHIHNCFPMGLSALFWAWAHKIPVIATNHLMPENILMNMRTGPLEKALSKLLWGFVVWFHQRAKVVTSPTPTAVRYLTDNGLTVPAKAISNGIDLSVFKPGLESAELKRRLGLATDRPVLLYLGRLDGEKRVDLIVKALPAILKQQPVQLVLAGNGNMVAGLKDLAASLGVEKDLIFTGYIAETDKPLIYNAADLFVIASPAELQSIVLLEAMASGLPLVSVDAGALKELCHDGENGYLFPRDDQGALALCVNRLVADPVALKAFGQKSLKIVTDSHGTEAMFSAYEAAYKEALASKN